MPDDFHGVRVIEVSDGPRNISILNTSVIGCVVTGDDADADMFPLNKPVFILNTDRALDRAGTTGSLSKTLRTFSRQGGAPCVIVRVPEDTDPQTQDDLIIGGIENGVRTGLQALLIAEAKLGVKPLIIGVPYHDTLAVAGELSIIAKELRAFVYVHADGATTKEEAVLYRQNFNQKEIEVCWPHLEDDNVTALALVMRSRTDQEIGFHKTISNIPFVGDMAFKDGMEVSYNNAGQNSDAQFLNDGEVTTIIFRNGFRFWGNRTCSDDPDFMFESAVRTGQIIAQTIENAHISFSDDGLLPGLVDQILQSLNSFLRRLVNQGRILGGEAWIIPEDNPKESVKAGDFVIDYDFMPVPPLEQLTLRQRITGRYASNLIA